MSMVYPRVCGGTLFGVIALLSYSGLSPRVRGNLARQRPRDVVKRSIPACAGEPESQTTGYSSRKVYPRVCGGTCLDVCEHI